VRTLRAQMQDAGEDLASFMAMTNVLEQACNRYLQTEEFPTSYEDLQPVPLQEVAQLTFAGDDGMKVGQTYRARSLTVSHNFDRQGSEEKSRESRAAR
jgi:putative transposase